MRQFHDSTKKIQMLLKEKENKPGPLVTKNLISNSLSNVFEEAKTEWEYLEPLERDSTNFVENCELCNSRLQVENHIIKNINTNKLLRIGSECIKRFVQFSGTTSQESSNTFFATMQLERKLEIEIRSLFTQVVIVPLPTFREANKFRRKLDELLESKGIKNLLVTSEGRLKVLQEVIKIENPSLKIQMKFSDFINGNIALQKETKKYRQQIKEGESWGKRKRVTNFTLASSKIYSDPSKKYD